LEIGRARSASSLLPEDPMAAIALACGVEGDAQEEQSDWDPFSDWPWACRRSAVSDLPSDLHADRPLDQESDSVSVQTVFRYDSQESLQRLNPRQQRPVSEVLLPRESASNTVPTLRHWQSVLRAEAPVATQLRRNSGRASEEGRLGTLRRVLRRPQSSHEEITPASHEEIAPARPDEATTPRTPAYSQADRALVGQTIAAIRGRISPDADTRLWVLGSLVPTLREYLGPTAFALFMYYVHNGYRPGSC
jgi:hypothetical protein